jgi:5-methylcytosine-specific restriction endonuclease McrA
MKGGHGMAFEFNRSRIDKLKLDAVLRELERVAELKGFVEFGKREFDKAAGMSSSTVVRTFGTWSKGVAALRARLRTRDINLKPRGKGYFSEVELFAEMERIWSALNHRPSRIEWGESKPRISYQTFVRYFGGWKQACLRFLERPSKECSKPLYMPSEPNEDISKTDSLREVVARNPREVRPGLRLKVYERDRFRCRYCGRTPITDLTVELHVDHIVPFASGGKTVLENLQTLCMQCNLGKGRRNDIRLPNIQKHSFSV